jgi:Salmonella virulence plasmid 65kDa B protein
MLAEVSLPLLDPMPAPVSDLSFGGPDGRLGVEIDLIRKTGRADAVPRLSLSYDGVADGFFGQGWSLSSPAISRGFGRRLPRYRDVGPDAEGYTADGHGELVPLLRTTDAGDYAPDRQVRGGFEVTRFRPRIEVDFARIERRRELSAGVVHWRKQHGTS